MHGVFHCRLTWNDIIQDKTIRTCAIDQEEGPRKEGGIDSGFARTQQEKHRV